MPDSIGSLVNLRLLDLCDNQLTSLPESIGGLVNLRALWLPVNQLTSITPQVGQLSNLREIIIHHNPNLTDLPLALGNCSQLTNLDCGRLYRDTDISGDRIDFIMNLCRSRRDSNVSNALPSLLKAWQNASGMRFDLSFITQEEPEVLSVKEKIYINEWLNRLVMTDDYNTDSQQDLSRAVCAMLQSLRDSPLFKETFFVQVPDNLVACGDRAAMSFNELYLAWKLDTLDSNIPEAEKLRLMVQAAKTAALRQALQTKIDQKEANNLSELQERSLRQMAAT